MNDRGLTLVELIVAMAVSAVAMAVGYAAFSSILDNRARVADAAAEVTRSSAQRRTLISWLEGARLTNVAGPRFQGLDGVFRDLPDDELTFLTTSDTPLGRGETIVRLYVDRDEETPERGLIVQLEEWRGLKIERITVDERVIGLETRYLSDVLGARRWLPSWVSSTVLPAAVELRLEAGTPESLPPLLAYPILVKLGGAL